MKIMRWTWIALKCGGIAVIAYVALGALGDLNPLTLVIAILFYLIFDTNRRLGKRIELIERELEVTWQLKERVGRLERELNVTPL